MTAPASQLRGDRRDMTAMPAALRRLAAALDDVLALSGLAAADRPAVAPSSPRRVAVTDPVRCCRWCRHPIPDSVRIDAQYCSTLCRKYAWRARTGRS